MIDELQTMLGKQVTVAWGLVQREEYAGTLMALSSLGLVLDTGILRFAIPWTAVSSVHYPEPAR